MEWRMALAAMTALFVAGHVRAEVSDPRDLRLIPFPKSVRLEEGVFHLQGGLSVKVGLPLRGPHTLAVTQLQMEIRARTGIVSGLSIDPRLSSDQEQALLLQPVESPVEQLESLVVPSEGGDEAYGLRVSTSGVAIRSRSTRGLLYGVQTLKQLVRANMRDNAIPCLTVQDWPSLRYRGFLDDITRGPSPRPATLGREIRLSAEVKQNFFTYYMEHQFAFSKHPQIGPKDGSLTPRELRDLVSYAEEYQMEVIGNQQSFGHFGHILKHKKYAQLRETPDLLCPTIEESYSLLDDLYSEEVPLLKSPFFNVCCDETWGLGTGPSKSLAESIGVGGVYARHIRRIHDLLKDKYGKRMMMWGDIILQHPDHLKEIPKDTVMLTWGYDARENFEDQIIPFARSGYEFFVCPGVNCWNRILPDFGVAVKNIQNFVRDGAKHGAMGVLNTTWDDDGENLFHYNWHGVFWGAECAWNAGQTDIGDFNRRFGAVLLGEPTDHLGKAIELLSRTHRLAGFEGMGNSRFWDVNLKKLSENAATARKQADELLNITKTAIEELHAAQADAKINRDLVDYLTFGAKRMKLMATRSLDFLDAAEAYEQACQLVPSSDETAILVLKAGVTVHLIREAHARLMEEYGGLWFLESKPYALDVVDKRFKTLIALYDSLGENLETAIHAQAAGKRLPLPSEIGFGTGKQSGPNKN